MIKSKSQLLRVIKETASSHKLNRDEKFQVFCRVCDSMLAENHITQDQHIRWTQIF